MRDKSPYKLHYLKGYYFGYSGKSLVSRLVYPIPDQKLQTLGIHATLDLSGRYPPSFNNNSLAYTFLSDWLLQASIWS